VTVVHSLLMLAAHLLVIHIARVARLQLILLKRCIHLCLQQRTSTNNNTQQKVRSLLPRCGLGVQLWASTEPQPSTTSVFRNTNSIKLLQSCWQ
jgi:hypothetical protein